MTIPETQKAKGRDHYVYRCAYCGFENRKKIFGSGVPITKQGSYGSDATPQPVAYADEMYEATTISFVEGAPDYLADSAYLFGEKHFHDGMTIRVAGSTSNDGDYTIATRGVSRGEILLSSSDSLTTESAGDTITISRVIYQPSITSGCPFCGSRNSK